MAHIRNLSKIIFFILIISFFSLISHPIFSCTCSKDSMSAVLNNPDWIIFKANVVFTGIDSTTTDTYGKHPYFKVLNVTHSWQGLDSSVQYLKLYEEPSSCSAKLLKDSTYLVYAYKAKCLDKYYPFIFTDLCTRTKLYSEAKSDLDSLGSSIIHSPIFLPNENNNDTPNSFWNLTNSLLVSIICILSLVLVLKKRKR